MGGNREIGHFWAWSERLSNCGVFNGLQYPKRAFSYPNFSFDGATALRPIFLEKWLSNCLTVALPLFPTVPQKVNFPLKFPNKRLFSPFFFSKKVTIDGGCRLWSCVSLSALPPHFYGWLLSKRKLSRSGIGALSLSSPGLFRRVIWNLLRRESSEKKEKVTF